MPDSNPPGALTVEAIRRRLDDMTAALPRANPDTSHARMARDEIARSLFFALHPADALDADFACQIVLLNAHADDCLRLATQSPHDPRFARDARAQARTMTRLMRGVLRDLHARQLARAEAHVQRPSAAPSAPTLLQPPRPLPPAASDSNASKQRAARIRELDLRVIATPDTRH
jgi:hypothetical protein